MSVRINLEKVVKKLDKLPKHIVYNLKKWASDVELIGLSEVRKRKGLHDEPLQGVRWGQRSVRLSKSYRAIYIQRKLKGLEVIDVIEVSKHEY